MESKFSELTHDIQLQPGESLSLPEDAAGIIGPGHWIVSIRPAEDVRRHGPIRKHSALMNSYSPEDEGLYDDYSAG